MVRNYLNTMNGEKSYSTRLLYTLINASAGVYRQYQITFWGQLVLGFLYSFGYFDSKIAGFVLGFCMPVLWVILTYRYVFIKAKEKVRLPFPRWMQKNPGNSLIIILDIIFLAFIWSVILTGIYEATWLKVLFTIIFPILTLSMLRNLVIFPFPKKDTQAEGHDSREEQTPNTQKEDQEKDSQNHDA